MKFISHFFFYTYVGLVILAGFWGAFVNPYYDFRLLFNADVHALPDSFRINLLSQYRFLRAIELGFGIFSMLFVRQIFTITKYNNLFLTIMCCGILGRVFSVLFDGQPLPLTWFFLLYELTGLVFIFIYTKYNNPTHAARA